MLLEKRISLHVTVQAISNSPTVCVCDFKEARNCEENRSIQRKLASVVLIFRTRFFTLAISNIKWLVTSTNDTPYHIT
jgi:hypothetical protein